MNCHDFERKVYLLLDGESRAGEEEVARRHGAGCASCRAKEASIRMLHTVLRAPGADIEPSAGFERRFWLKAAERGGEAWWTRFLREMDSRLYAPAMREAAAFVLLAFLLGGAGGFAMQMSELSSVQGQRASIRYLSGFREFKGVPDSSVAATYLKSVREGSSS